MGDNIGGGEPVSGEPGGGGCSALPGVEVAPTLPPSTDVVDMEVVPVVPPPADVDHGELVTMLPPSVVVGRDVLVPALPLVASSLCDDFLSWPCSWPIVTEAAQEVS
jgi:hypothetical protein